MIVRRLEEAIRKLLARLTSPAPLPHNGPIPNDLPIIDRDEETVRELRTALREKQVEGLAAQVRSLDAQARAQSSAWRQEAK